MTARLDLDSLHLDTGAHAGPEEGACIMEAVALLAGEKWSDTPACASPVLGAIRPAEPVVAVIDLDRAAPIARAALARLAVR